MPYFHTSPIERKFSIKDIIIEILSEEYPLTIRKTYNILRKDYGKQVSYQAVYKAVYELVDLKILEKKEKEYSLNKDYIEKLNNFVNKLMDNYKRKSNILEELSEKSLIIRKLNSQYEMIFLLLDILKRIKKGELLTITWTTTWPPLLIPEVHSVLEDLNKRIECYCISYGDGFLDKKFAKHWRELGMKIKLGVKINKMYESFAFEDRVIIIYQSPEKRLQKYRYINLIKGLTTLDRDNFFMKLFKEKLDIYMIIIKNPELADKIKQEVISYF